MPVIKIREDIEKVTSPVTGQSNAVVVPLFVSSQRVNKDTLTYTKGNISCKLYSSVSEFDKVETITINNKDCSNNPVGLGAMAIKDADGAVIDNSYYYIKSLLNSGMKVYVYPVDLIDEDIQEIAGTFIDNELKQPKSNTTGSDIENQQIPNETVDTEGNEDDGYKILFTRYKNPGDDLEFSKVLKTLADDGYFNSLKDKMTYNFKFFTTGAHANAYFVELLDNKGNIKDAIDGPYKSLLKLCVALKDDASIKEGRGDCLFTLDFDSRLTKIGYDFFGNGNLTIYDAMNEIEFADGSEAQEVAYGKFGFCTYPWVKKDTDNSTIELPGSFAYLMAFAGSTITEGNMDYAAIAGYARGGVSLEPVEVLGDIDCHVFQSDSFSDYAQDEKMKFKMTINPIVKYPDNVYRIKGNRVMSKPPIGTDGVTPDADNVRDCTYFLNVRHTIMDIKKECFMASDRVQFEPNDDVTWVNFLNWVNPLLEEMITNRGLDWYSWKKLDTNGVKGLIKARVTVKPIEAVESFDITVFVKNTDEE